jgi:hypothetical protein
VDQGIINLSKEKWQWMADKNADALDKLVIFHQAAYASCTETRFALTF